MQTYWADSSGRRNTTAEEVAMSGRRRSDRALRPVLKRSPGRPGVAQRDNRRRFWAAIATGVSSEEAASSAGVSHPVGDRWFREAGGMPPKILAPSSKPKSERHLSFAEREEIALLRVQGCGVRETARRLGRDASTISRGRTHCVRQAQRGHARRQPGVSGHNGTVACRAGGASAEARQAGGECAIAEVCAGAAGRGGCWPWRVRGSRACLALEKPAPWSAPAPSLGQGLEP